jgi:hypothetical protein
MYKFGKELLSDHLICESVAMAATALNSGDENKRKVWV